jgi:prophage regulatory protein
MPQHQYPERLLLLREVMERTTYSRSSIYAKIVTGEFPAPIVIGPNRVAWPESAIQAWISEKIAAA